MSVCSRLLHGVKGCYWQPKRSLSVCICSTMTRLVNFGLEGMLQTPSKKGVALTMDTKCSVFIAASVDGFIARPDGNIEWLHRPEYECPVLRGLTYDEFMTTVDALVMGRKTLDKVLSFPEWPYENKRVVVLSHGEV